MIPISKIFVHLKFTKNKSSSSWRQLQSFHYRLLPYTSELSKFSTTAETHLLPIHFIEQRSSKTSAHDKNIYFHCITKYFSVLPKYFLEASVTFTKCNVVDIINVILHDVMKHFLETRITISRILLSRGNNCFTVY